MKQLKPSIEIVRLEENYAHGTFGTLKLNKALFCWTLEPRDEENASFISSIPAQQYECRRYSSARYPDTFQIMNVPGRELVLFHIGNKDDHTEGCILLGSTLGRLKGDKAILNSGATFKRFMDALDGVEEFILTVNENY